MDEFAYYRRLAELVPSHPWESTVPILIRRGTQLAQHGTGTLFAVGTDSFLVTAAHVVRTAKQADTSLYFAATDNGFVQLAGNWMISDDLESKAVLDIAVLLLDTELKQRLSSAKFLRIPDVSFDFNSEYAVYCIYGFPAIWAHKNEANPSILSAKGLQFTTYAFEGNSSALEKFDSNYHLLMAASLDETRDASASPVRFAYRGGVTARFPSDLGGISGCSVWHVGDRRHTLEKWPTIEPRLVGVETSVYPDKNAIRATRWSAVATVLYTHFDQTRSVFHLHGISS